MLIPLCWKCENSSSVALYLKVVWSRTCLLLIRPRARRLEHSGCVDILSRPDRIPLLLILAAQVVPDSPYRQLIARMTSHLLKSCRPDSNRHAWQAFPHTFISHVSCCDSLEGGFIQPSPSSGASPLRLGAALGSALGSRSPPSCF